MYLYLMRGCVMVLPVEISDLKKHLNIDIDDDDSLLAEYEAAAVKQYIRCQVGDFYKQREITATGQFATFYKHLLDPYCLKYRDDEEN